jgi:hypothetical protein
MRSAAQTIDACRLAAGMRRAATQSWAALAAGAVALLFAAASIATAEEKSMSLTITSTAFASNASIPSLYTCEGKDVSPPLAWSGVPAGTQSLALIVDDPDAPDPAAPKMTWVHWVLYEIAAAAGGLPEAVKSTALPAGTREGASTIGVAPGMAGRARRSAATATSTSSTRSTPSCLNSSARTRPRWRRRCRDTSSHRQR